MKTPIRSIMKHSCHLPFNLTLTQSLLLTMLLIFQLIHPEASYSQSQPSEGYVVGWGNRVIIPESYSDFTHIAAGSGVSIGVRSDGSVVAWGANGNSETDIPDGLDDVVKIAAGRLHNLALRSDGTLVGWGFNTSGQADIPEGADDILEMAAGDDFSLVLRQNGTVVAWGGNEFGQTDVPVGLNDVIAVAARGARALALRTSTAGILNQGFLLSEFLINPIQKIRSGVAHCRR